LDAVGADLEAAMHNISTLNVVTGTVGNKALFAKVVAYYQDKLDVLDSNIITMENNYEQEKLNDLKRSQPFALYGGIDQPLAYQASELNQMTCGFSDLLLATPSNVKSQLPNFNRYNLAEYLELGPLNKFGSLKVCVFGTLLNPVRINCTPEGCDQAGQLEATIKVYYHDNNDPLRLGTALNSQSVLLGPATITVNDTADSYVIRHWAQFQPIFEAKATIDAPTPAEAAQRAALLAKITTDLNNLFVTYQQALENRVETALVTGALHPQAIEIAGSAALLDSFVNLGLPRAVDTDDFIHAMLYGDQRLTDDSQIIQSYAISGTQPLTATDILVNPRLVIKQTAQERQQAFTELVNHYLDAITAKQYSEATDYLANTRRALDLTVRIAQVEGQTTPAGGNQIYLPLVKR